MAALCFHRQNLEKPYMPFVWRMDKEDVYTMQYYIAEKNNDILNFAGKWVGLKNILLSEVTQTQKDKYIMDSLTGSS